MLALRATAFQARRALSRCVVQPESRRMFCSSQGSPIKSVCVVGAGQMGSVGLKRQLTAPS